jgi:hypothetical protein
MPLSESSVTDLELRYPFTPRSREFFDKVPLTEALSSEDVMAKTESRLLNSIGRGEYEPTFTDIDLSSFFAAALVASQDGVLTSKYSTKEAERAKEFFKDEKPKDKVAALSECYGIKFEWTSVDDRHVSYSAPFQSFISLTSKLELVKNAKWKLVRQDLDGGIIRMGDNLMNDFFGDCARAVVSEGVRNFRKAPFPKELVRMRDKVLQFVPSPRPRTNKGYLYVEDLLAHPVSDGRHRLTWLVLAPYLVNVKKLDDEQAIEKIRTFVATAGETSAMRRFIEYNVRRARRNGLLPPTFSTLKTEHPDIYWLLPKEVVAAESAPKKGFS